MAEYDGLPAEVRALVREQAYNSRSANVSDIVARHGHDEARVVLRHLTEEECYRTYGPAHPQSDAHGRRLRRNHIATW